MLRLLRVFTAITRKGDLMDTEKLKVKLSELAEKEISGNHPSFNACEDSGGNFDDAYSTGFDDGRTSLARELLNDFFKD